MNVSTIARFTTAVAALVAAQVLIHPGPASASLSDCPSGYMCVWSQADYSGTMFKTATASAYKSIGLSTTESYFNNRSRRTWLHEKADGSGSYVCLNPGAKKASGLSGWMDNAKGVWLATPTNC